MKAKLQESSISCITIKLTHMNFLLLAQILFRLQVNNIKKANNNITVCIPQGSLISTVFRFILFIVTEVKGSELLLCSCKQYLQSHLSTPHLQMLRKTVMKNIIGLETVQNQVLDNMFITFPSPVLYHRNQSHHSTHCIL